MANDRWGIPFLSNSTSPKEDRNKIQVTDATSSKYVYGIKGIADFFGSSIPTANRIKKRGKIDKAIKQIDSKIIVEADLALQLAGEKKGGGRRMSKIYLP